MTGQVLYIGGRLPTVTVVSGTVVDNDNAEYINTTYTDAGIDTGSTPGVARGYFYDPASAPLLVPYAAVTGSTYYFHAQLGLRYAIDETHSWPLLQLVDAAGDPWIQLNTNGFLQYNSGTGVAPVWTNLHTTAWTFAGFNSSAPEAIDIILAFSGTGTHQITLAFGGVAVVGPVSFTQASLGLAGFILGSNIYAGGPTVWSEILCTQDLSTVGAHVAVSRPNGAGTHSDWAGTYTDVNAALTQTTTVNQATTAGLNQTYTMSNITVPTGYVIGSVFEWLYAKNDGGSPANIEAICTPAGTDYTSGDLNGISVTFAGIGSRYDVNPATSAAWTQAQWNAPTDMGFASAA